MTEKEVNEKDEIEEKNPLKQGLKQLEWWSWRHRRGNWREESIKTRIETTSNIKIVLCYQYWREESIKTRIETKWSSDIQHPMFDWREESIKTRIETLTIIAIWEYKIFIEEKNPLKQGLKHLFISYFSYRCKSLKRRIH